MTITVIPTVISILFTVTKWFLHGLEELKNKSTSRDHPDYSIIKIGKNT